MEESGDTAIQSIAERNAIIGRYNVVLVKNYFSCDCQCIIPFFFLKFFASPSEESTSSE